MAEAGPWNISHGVTVSAYSLRFGYGDFLVPANQSSSGKAFGCSSSLPSGIDDNIAYTLAIRTAPLPFQYRYPCIACASG